MSTSSTNTTITVPPSQASVSTMSLDEASMKARSAAARAYALKSSIDFSTPPVRPATSVMPPLLSTGLHQHSLLTQHDTSPTIGRSVVHDEDYGKWLKDIVNSTSGTDAEFDDPEDAFLMDPSTIDSDDEEFQFLEDFDVEAELGNELGSLLEEDLEAAVTTLISTSSAQHPTPQKKTTPSAETPPRTPLRDAAASRATFITQQQSDRLKELMTGHYQLLVQQTVLCVRAAQRTKQKVHSGESQEDLAEILDGAVGMLQDLDQNRKDAIRNSIQLQQPRSAPPSNAGGRLTRAAFSRTLQHTSATTSFDVKGLANLSQTFHILDNSKDHLIEMQEPDACDYLLKESGARIDSTFVPSTQDVSLLLSDAKEVFGPDFLPPATEAQVMSLRKDRNQFTAAEDSLVFRGVNLYGEKQWLLIADRYLPDRSVNIISQRYSKLSVLLYRAHGVKIDAAGNLETPPKHESVDRVNENLLNTIKKVAPPAILNVHRWSIEEDLTLLKAVPILGHMWAELSARYVPHRDRGHLRKRHQVLERRIKATVNRAAKETPKYLQKNGVLKRAQQYRRHNQLNFPPKLPAHAKFPPRNAVSVSGAQAKRPAPVKNPSSKASASSSLLHRPPPKLTPKGRASDSSQVGGPGCPEDNLQTPPGSPRVKKEKDEPNPKPLFPNDSDSRHHFEKLVSADDEWSQTSRFKKLIEAEPKSAAIEHFPQMDMNQNSGLSLLGEMVLSQESASSVEKTREPLISKVLKGTPDSSRTEQPEKSTSVAGATARSPITSLSRCDNLQADDKPDDIIPASLSQFPGASFSCSHLSPPSKSFGSFKGQHGFGLAENNSLLGATDGYEYCTFSISEKSRQALESPTKNAALGVPSLAQSSQPPSFMTDMEAISALNALSNSPAKSFSQQPLCAETDDEEKEAAGGVFTSVASPSEPSKKRTPKAKRSLFDTVVGTANKNKKAKTK